MVLRLTVTQGVAILSRWPFSISRIFVVDVVVAVVAVIIAVIVIPASPGPRPDAAAAAAVVVVVADCRLNPGLSSFDERRIKVCLGW